MKDFKRDSVLIIGFCLLQVLSNLTVMKSVQVFVFAIPIGSILYAFSFTWMDVSNHCLGINKIRFLLKTMVIVNVLIALWFRLYIVLPTNEWSSDSFEANAISLVYGNYYRITIASVIAGYVSGNANASIFDYFKHHTKTVVYVWSIVSNVVASCIDGLAFYVIAFAFEKPWNTLFLSATSSAVYKGMISLLSVPMLYFLKRKGFFNNSQ